MITRDRPLAAAPGDRNTMASSDRQDIITVIDGRLPSWARYGRDLYDYREVARVLIRRDLIVRFRQAFFGIAWLLFKPLMMMLVISLAFGFISRFEDHSAAPYPLVVLCGVIPWYFLSNAIPDGMNSIVAHLHILQKTYFPRIIIPLVAVAINVIEFITAWLLFALACAWYGFIPGWQVAFLPLFLLLAVALGTGLSLWLSMLHARFRDVGNLIPFLISIAFFVTPIGYTLASVPERWRHFFLLNPVAGIVEGIRWSLLGETFAPPLSALASATAIVLATLVSGLWFFRRNESTIVDMG